MTIPEIEGVVSQFARAARLCAEAGFDGVEVHAAHGYLLSQFLSSKSNRRGDGYGGDARGRARMLVEVVRAVKEATKGFKGFCVGVKLNSVDHQSEGEMRDCVEQVRAVVEAGVDFVEVSGGSYEDPKVSLFCCSAVAGFLAVWVCVLWWMTRWLTGDTDDLG
jgi:2,4-dienoyl-CoA reductase-like NADH-dependent reductase (Old Yellow Enzyme family)